MSATNRMTKQITSPSINGRKAKFVLGNTITSDRLFESPKTILQTDDNGIERWFPDGGDEHLLVGVGLSL